MKKLAVLFITAGMATASFATLEDGVAVLGANPTEAEIEMVRAGAKTACSEIEGYEEKEQCAMDYYAAHNYNGEPDCE